MSYENPSEHQQRKVEIQEDLKNVSSEMTGCVFLAAVLSFLTAVGVGIGSTAYAGDVAWGWAAFFATMPPLFILLLFLSAVFFAWRPRLAASWRLPVRSEPKPTMREALDEISKVGDLA